MVPRTDWTVRPAAPSRGRRRRDGLIMVGLAVLLAVLLSAGGLLIINHGESGQQRNGARITTADRKARTAAVKLNGVVGCLQRANRRTVNRCLGRQAIPAAPGADGARGASVVGRDGLAGARGNNGKDGEDGAPGVGTPGSNGTNGTSGRDGNDATAAGIEAAVRAFCKATDCNGTNGTNGTDGKDGAPGPGPTDAQVQAAVDAYCATHNNCTPAAPPVPAPAP